MRSGHTSTVLTRRMPNVFRFSLCGEQRSPVVGDDGQDMVEHGKGGFSGELGARHCVEGNHAQSLVMQAGVLRQAHDSSQYWEDKAV